jgi:hypothetical protein
MGTGTKVLIGVIVLAAVGGGTYFLIKKMKPSGTMTKRSDMTSTATSTGVDPMVAAKAEAERLALETKNAEAQAVIDADTKKRIDDCKTKCNRQLLIPVVGIGLVYECRKKCS